MSLLTSHGENLLCPLKRHTHHGPDVTDCQAGVLSRSSCSGSLGALLRGSPLCLRGSFLGTAQMRRDLLGYLGTHLDFHLIGRYADDERDGFPVHVGGLVEPADLGEGSRMLIALHDPLAGRPVSGRRVAGHFVHHLVPKAGDSCLKISVAPRRAGASSPGLLVRLRQRIADGRFPARYVHSRVQLPPPKSILLGWTLRYGCLSLSQARSKRDKHPYRTRGRGSTQAQERI